MKLHPQDLTLLEMMESLASPEQAVLKHLLTCKACLDRARVLFSGAPISTETCSNVVPLDRWVSTSKSAASALHLEQVQAAFETERGQADRLAAELIEQSAERRRLLALNQVRFQTWGVCEQLLNHSRELSFSDAAQGEKLALLATEITDRLEDSRYGHERVEDLRARAWAYLGNSRRILSDLAGADSAFERAMVHLKHGTGEPMERAMILDLRASLYRAQRRFEEALRSLRRAVSIFRELGETHRAGRSLLGMAILYQVQGAHETAIPLIYEAIDLIEPEREPRLVHAAWHGLIDSLAELGRFLEAHKLSSQARPILQQFSEPWALNPRRWVEGRIARGLGQEDHAERLFLFARNGFLAENAPFEVALISLDLAALYLEQRRTAEALRVTEEAIPIFTSRGIHREALAALLFWKEALDADRAEAGLASSVARFLKRARHDPALRFEEPGTSQSGS